MQNADAQDRCYEVSNNLRSYIMAIWEIQETLLQTFRSHGMVIQTLLISASIGALAVYFGFDRNQISTPIPFIALKFLLLFLVLLLTVFGISNLVATERICRIRQRNVNFCQSLLIYMEHGKLAETLANCGFHFQGGQVLPVLSMMKLWQQDGWVRYFDLTIESAERLGDAFKRDRNVHVVGIGGYARRYLSEFWMWFGAVWALIAYVWLILVVELIW